MRPEATDSMQRPKRGRLRLRRMDGGVALDDDWREIIAAGEFGSVWSGQIRPRAGRYRSTSIPSVRHRPRVRRGGCAPANRLCFGDPREQLHQRDAGIMGVVIGPVGGQARQARAAQATRSLKRRSKRFGASRFMRPPPQFQNPGGYRHRRALPVRSPMCRAMDAHRPHRFPTAKPRRCSQGSAHPAAPRRCRPRAGLRPEPSRRGFRRRFGVEKRQRFLGVVGKAARDVERRHARRELDADAPHDRTLD